MLGARLVWLNRELEFRKMRVHELFFKYMSYKSRAKENLLLLLNVA